MSTSGPGPEYLDIGSGGPLPPTSESSSGRRTAVAAVAVGGLVVLLGAGAWAAWSFFSTGPQPAEALPASTVAYASIDLDPSGGQKIEALRTLQKFPAFEDEVGLETDDDVRQWIFEQVQDSGGCPDVDYRDDIEPWLGDRFAVAAVDTGGDTPDPVFVVQVSDEDRADTGLQKLADCADGEDVAWAIRDGWALVGEKPDVVDKISAEAADSPLSDDDDFRHWTDEAGGSGIATVYLAPGLGVWLADHADDFLGPGLPLLGDDGCTTNDDGSVSCTSYGFAPAGYQADDDITPDDLAAELKDFQGAAATLRFDGGSLELEMAGDTGKDVGTSDDLADVIGNLPDDTAFAYGMGLEPGWADDLLASDDLVQQLEDASGLQLPDDLETLLGEAAVVSVGGDFDPDTFSDSSDGSDVPVGLTVQGDPDAIQEVLGRVGGDEPVLVSDTDGDLIAIGPDADYRARLLDNGDLGTSETFRDAVPDADGAAVVGYASFDAGDWLDHVADDEPEVAENLRPLVALGFSAHLDDGISHVVLRVTTD